jgi:hypothetical protein
MVHERSKDDASMSKTNKTPAAVAVLLAALTAGVLVWSGCGGNRENRVGGGEFAKRIEVSAEVNRAPAVGETTLLVIGVESSETYERATMTIELPANMQFDRLPVGLRVTALTTPNPSRGGPRAVGSVALTAGQPLHVQARLRANAGGTGEISVAVTAPIPLGVEGGADYVFVAVGPS